MNLSRLSFTLRYIVKRITQKELTLEPQLEKLCDQGLEELLYFTEGKLYNLVTDLAQNLVQCESKQEKT